MPNVPLHPPSPAAARRDPELEPRLLEELSWAGSTESPGVIDAAMRLVTSLAGSVVRGADGVSITLGRRGHMVTVAGSDETVRRMDEHQYATGEGPCLSAASEGRWVHSRSLAEEERWPTFVPRAVEEGIASILSTPLVVSAHPAGAINMYSRGDGAFGAAERRMAAFFARHAGGILGEAIELDGRQRERIAEALASRDLIAMAQGVLMGQLGISADAAAARLHRSARSQETTVRAEAAAVCASAGTTEVAADDSDG